MLNKQLSTIVMVVSLSACGDGSDTVVEEIIEPVSSVPELNQMAMTVGSLVLQNGIGFELHLKNGIYLRNRSDLKITLADAPESSSTANSTNYSLTTVQEQNVDEGDRIKYDGQYLFIANQDENFHILEGEKSAPQTSVRIMKREDSGTINEISSLTVSEEASQINSLYLKDDMLAVLSDIYDYGRVSSTFYEDFFPTEQSFNLSFVSVDDPQTPDVEHSFVVEGSIIDSRRVDNTLYVISSYSARLEGINYASTEEDNLANYNTILATNISDLLPKYTDINGQKHELVAAENCYLPEDTSKLDGFDGIVTLTAIDLTQPENLESICVNAQVEGLYASEKSVYLYGTDYQYQAGSTTETSVIHKFSVQGQQIQYKASGTLDGRFNWNLSNLRFSEQGDYLRVVTTSGNRSEGYHHKLNVLSEEGNTLNVIAHLPNDLNQKLVGKVSEDGNVYEDIKSVRFYQQQAYIVTFLNTDPLYIIDLKDNLTPNISGELEIPGYSAYLQPLSDSLLLGIGQNVDPGRILTSNSDEEVSPIIEGAKVTLFDISDVTAPKEIHSIVYEDAYTPVEYDYHALTQLSMSDGSKRFAMPLERWLTETYVDENQQKYDIWRSESDLVLFEISGITKDAALKGNGKIRAAMQDEDPNNPVNFNAYDDRGLFHGDDIYYIRGSRVWQSRWLNPENVLGPF